MRKFETNEEIEKIIQNSKNEQKTAKALDFTAAIVKENHLTIENYRWQSLANHVAAMVDRSITGEILGGIEQELFEEISHESIVMAQKIVDYVSKLDDNEKYLLSVHFETAKI